MTITTPRWLKLALNMQQSVRTDQCLCGAQSSMLLKTRSNLTQMCFRWKFCLRSEHDSWNGVSTETVGLLNPVI